MVGGRGKDPLCCDKGECLKQNSVCRGKQQQATSATREKQVKTAAEPVGEVTGGSGVAETGCWCERKKSVCTQISSSSRARQV